MASKKSFSTNNPPKAHNCRSRSTSGCTQNGSCSAQKTEVIATPGGAVKASHKKGPSAPTTIQLDTHPVLQQPDLQQPDLQPILQMEPSTISDPGLPRDDDFPDNGTDTPMGEEAETETTDNQFICLGLPQFDH